MATRGWLARWGGWMGVMGLAMLGAAFGVWGASRVLYETRFEASEGFDPELTLIGQGGWVGAGTGGNGLVTGFFEGEGQHAFLGFGAPTNRDEFVNVWRPVNHVPGPTNPPIVTFSVLMSVEDSTTTTNRDDFRWSAYTVAGERLFSIDFDNHALEINYLLETGDFVSTGRLFTNAVAYQLEVRMAFQENRWSAWLDGTPLVTNQVISVRTATPDFGDMDAVWAIREAGKPGDNYLVFDNYRVVAEEAEPNPAPRLEALGLLRPGEFLVRGHGVPGVRYVLEATGDLRSWEPVRTNILSADGFFDHLDRGAGAWRFYRMVER